MSSRPAHAPDLLPRIAHCSGAVVLWAVAFLGAQLAVVPVFFVDVPSMVSLGVSVVLGQGAYVVVAVLFLVVTGRGLGYLDLDVPTRWRLIAAVTAGIFAFRMAVVLISWNSGFVPAAPSGLTEAPGYRDLFLLMIPASLLVIGPAEELLFRGTIQKYLRERFSAWPAIAGAGILYTLPHLATLYRPSTVDVLLTMAVLFLFALAFGWLYERTGTVVAPMIAHGAFNAMVAVSAIVLVEPHP